MYQLNINLVGCDETVAPHVRCEVLNQWATIVAEFPDVQSAVTTVHRESADPTVFIVQIDSADQICQVKHLSSTFPGRPIVALLTPGPDASFVFKAMRAGAAQVVALPLQRADFQAALDCIAVQFGLVPGRARTIAVCAANGGCGASTIALNLAYEVAWHEQLHCILIELALRMGVLANLLDVQPRHITSDLFAAGDHLDRGTVQDALTRISEKLSILPGPYRTIESIDVVPERALKLIEIASCLAQVVVLDVPATYDDLFFRTLAGVDHVVLVTDQRVCAVRGAQIVRDALPQSQPVVVVNRYDPKVASFTVERLREILGLRGVFTVARDDAIMAAANNGQPLRLQASKSHALADVDALVRHLLPHPDQSHTAPRDMTILGRLSRALCFSAAS